MADRNTKLRKGQISSDSVEPLDLDANNSPSPGDVPTLGVDGQFEWTSLTGGGDMLKSVYDTDNDGIIDKAENVDDGASGGIHASTAEQVRDAVDKKHDHSNKSELDLVTDGDHDVRTDNPHSVTKAQVGLGNVDNKSEATIITDVKADTDVADAISKKHASGSDNQTADTVPTNESGVSVQDKLTELENAVPDVDDFTIINNAGVLKVADRIEQNIMLLAFLRAVDQSKTIYNLIDGIIDEYEDESGIDTGASTNESYDSGNDLYTNAKTSNKEVDYMEYASNALAQAAYVSSDPDIEGGIDSYTKLMLHANGEDGAQTYTAETGQTVTFVGTAQLDTAVKKFGSACLLLDGDSDYLTIPDSSDWDLGTDDFTIDFWVYFNTLPASGAQVGLVSHFDGSTGWATYLYNVSGTLTLYLYSFDDAVNINKATTFSTATWYHIAIVRSGNSWYWFKDGTQIGTTGSSSGSLQSATTPLKIGYRGDSGYLDGSIDEFRLSKGIARWTSNFSVPTEEYTENIVGNLQCYSEATIKNQGSYSLKAIAKITDSINDTLTRSLDSGDHIDLSGYNTIKVDIYASRTGTNLQLQIHDSGGTTSSFNLAVNSANTWETKTIDISGISDANKNDIDSVIIKVTNADAENTFYLDNIYAVGMTNNMTLIANAVTAEAEPTQARIVLFEEDVDAVTLNTDIKAWVSIDNGSNYDQITLADEGDWETGKRILSGIVDVSARTGTSIKYKVTTHNGKELKLHGTACSWA